MSKEIRKLVVALGKEFNAQKVRQKRDQITLLLDPDTLPTSLRQARLGVRRAMRKAGFRSQARDLFPIRKRRQPTSFYVRKTGADDEAIIALVGTPEKPALVIAQDQ